VSTRRQFLKHTAAGVMTAAAAPSAFSATSAQQSLMKARKENSTTTALSIKSLVRREETLLRYGGYGDGLNMTWATDDRQFVALQDGIAWGPNWDKKRIPGLYNSRLLSIRDGPIAAVFEEVAAYPELTPSPELDIPRYYGFGTLALDGGIYQFLSTLNHKSDAPWRWVGAKLIYSPDNGRSWCNQDGSTPVAWEAWERQSPDTLVFFKEPQEAFSLLSILQMGRNYSANRDGYVYVYSTNGNIDGEMNQLVMFRVPRQGILNRAQYEYFSGLTRGSDATWSKDIKARAVVHTFPRGWVNKANHPDELVTESWLPSVVYNAPLELYMMVNWGIGRAPDGAWFGRPSYLGFWVAPQPWGPWIQVHEETAWAPGGDPAARAFDVQIAPKWIAEDGKSFWLVWADNQSVKTAYAEHAAASQTAASSPDLQWQAILQMHKSNPYYGFNTQRVDLIIR
jgi:hypothetical protein